MFRYPIPLNDDEEDEGMNAPILNSLLRADGVSLELQPPFEKPNDAIDLVYELPTHHQDLSAWCKQVSEIISDESDLLTELTSKGCLITLFIEPSTPSSVLRVPHDFLSMIAGMKISLEIYSPR